MLTDVTRLNFFEVARAAFSRNICLRHEVRTSARRTSPLTMVKNYDTYYLKGNHN